MIQLRTMILSLIMLIIMIILLLIAAAIYLALSLLGNGLNTPFTCTSCQIVTMINRQERMRERGSQWGSYLPADAQRVVLELVFEPVASTSQNKGPVYHPAPLLPPQRLLSEPPGV